MLCEVGGVACRGGAWGEGLLGASGLTVLGPSVFSLLVPQVPLDSAPATCHKNVMKQTMVDSSCRVLTSDVFRECNRLVRAAGDLGGRHF